MTIPIIPGPFAFIGEAGQAAGNVGKAILTRRQMEEEDATRGLSTIMQLIAANRLSPSALNSPFVQDLFKRSGIGPPGPLNLIPSIEEAKARGLEQYLKDHGTPQVNVTPTLGPVPNVNVSTQPNINDTGTQIALGLPTGQQTAEADLGAAVAGARTESAPAAAVATDTAEAGKAKMLQHITDIVQQNLTDPKSQFSYLASAAAAGELPYLIAELQSRAQIYGYGLRYDPQRANALLEPIKEAMTTYRSRIQKWDTDVQNYKTLNPDATDEEVAKAVGPQPNVANEIAQTVGTIAPRLFPNAADPTQAYFDAFKQLAGALTGSDQQGTASGVDRGKRISTIQQAAKLVADGKVDEQVARERIVQSATKGFAITDLSLFNHELQQAKSGGNK